MTTVDFKIKKWFFDPRKISDPIERANKRWRSRVGAVVRTRARRLIRKRSYKRKSKEGELPFYHTRPSIRKIFFGLDPSSDSVIVGPVRFNTPNNVPELLAKGGLTRVRRKGKRPKRYMVKARKSPVHEALKSGIKDLPDLFAKALV